MQPVILWFRRNLRLADNSALISAARSGRPVISVYVHDDEVLGGASRWWLHHSLNSLGRDLRNLGSQLIICKGSPGPVLHKLAHRTGATAIYYARRYEPESRRQEEELRSKLGGELGIHAVDDGLLCEPTAVMTTSQTPFKVFTPFWKAAARMGEPRPPQPLPAFVTFAQQPEPSTPLDELELLPSSPDWAEGLRDTWRPGESAALHQLAELDSAVQHYAQRRDRPDLDATSRLSPHLHFGEISVRQAWHTIRNLELSLQATAGAEALLRQLYWRDFSSYLLFHFPELPDKPLRSEFESFPWSNSEAHLRAWQRGMTGYPIVDAGMRQLWTTGWMHNRVRMIVASFLVKDLLLPWQQGAAWFFDTLVDADLASNSASWQWVAGCGTDAAPYFRIFNPTVQAQKFDPHDRYVRRWIPELTDPAAGDYPEPIVDHRVARRRALDAYDSIKGMRTSKNAPGSSLSRSFNAPP